MNNSTESLLIRILRGVIGIIFIIGVCILLSENRKKISWRIVITGMLAQFILGVGVVYIPFFYKTFEFIGKIFIEILNFSKNGAHFVFGELADSNKFGFIFAFQILPVIIFFGALTGALYYYGIIQRIVKIFAFLLQRLLNLTGAESIATSANMFLGQSESPLLVKPYLNNMSRSEIFLIMCAGMSMLAGSVLAAYIGFLGGQNPAEQLFFAKHLIAASIMAAPGAIVVSKIIVPQTEIIIKDFNFDKSYKSGNVLNAISNGTSDGLKLAVNVAAMLVVFIGLISLFNFCVQKIGDWTTLNNYISASTMGKYHTLSLQLILGYIFSPVMWLTGICSQDIMLAGRLLGEKMILTEFIGYLSLADLKTTGAFFQEKSVILSTYFLSGFANFASIGIQIACIGTLAPSRKLLVSRLGIKAMIAGTLVSLLSACFIGILIP
jgi:CNT family concentrative nucleoside transporter